MGEDRVQRLRKRGRDAWEEIWDRASDTSQFWLVRFLFLRMLGFVYLAAFVSLALQLEPLLGSEGLTPVTSFLESYGSQFDSTLDAFLQRPSIFWFHASDMFMQALAWIGVLVSLAVLLGYANVPMLFFNWAVYLSFVHVGQVWYGYGWEIQLLETGFLAMFLVPLLDPRPFARSAPPVAVIWLLRWMTFRVYLGAGLIKLKGDQCWRQLTCLYHHFETQPIPSPVSPWLDALPKPFLKAGVVWNHVVELIVPSSIVAGPVHRQIRNIGGVLLVTFQLFLIISGNLSFLNWLTIAAAVSFFDDRFLARYFPSGIVERLEEAKQETGPSRWRTWASLGLVVLVAVLSVPVVVNMLSPGQAMNTSYDRLNLVNTYGAFGGVTETRHEVVVQGTRDPDPRNADWKEYRFYAKPDDPAGLLPVVAPYQPRLSWQTWFAGIHASRGARPGQEPWLIHLVWKLLENDEETLELVTHNPFPDRPPRYIRIQLFTYEFTGPLSEGMWNRSLVGTWLQPVSKGSARMEQYVQRRWGAP
jgi:hypothetical protein